MKRFVNNTLLKWKNSKNRKSLLLRGARQVGKTYAVREFGKGFDNFVEFNLERMQSELAPIFEASLDPIKIIRELSIISGKPIIPGKTLLFFDEIQAVPRALLALRYLYEEIADLHVIGAGSLLDFTIEQVGIPVGRVQSLYMYPVSFLEFLAASGHNLLIEAIINHEPNNPISDAIHNKLLSLLGEYLAVGGMPEAVRLWIQGDTLESFEVHKTIIDTYKQDFNKYAKVHQIKYLDILFKNISNQIGKKFKFSDVGEYRKRELMPALELLSTARVIHMIKRSVGNGIPLGHDVYQDDFKVVLLDVALNQVMLGEKKNELLRETLGNWFLKPMDQFVNKGNILEAFVAQEIIAYSDPAQDELLYCWRRDAIGSEAEVDYLIQVDDQIVPIEVKSGSGSTLKSMHMFLESHTNSKYGIRLSIENYSVYEKICSYPLYAIASLFLRSKDVTELLMASDN